MKIAHRQSELEQAFSLLHEAYVKAGFMTPNESGLRVTKYHSLPSTTTIVAMIGDEVVGTVSVVRDGLFGFPSDSLVDKSEMRKSGLRVAEVSSLAISSKYRRKSHGLILWPLIAHLVRYSKDYFGTDCFVIAVHPTQFDFYEGILFFERLTSKPIKSYGFVNDNPAMCGLLNLRKFYDDLWQEYGKKDVQKNIFNYIFKTKHEFLRFPRRDNFKISDPFLKPELITYFFKEKTNVFEQMTEREVAILHSLYVQPQYREVLPALQESNFTQFYERQSTRFDVSCDGQVLFAKAPPIRLKIQNVSGGGFMAMLYRPLRFGEEYEVQIAVAEFKIASLVCKPVWTDGQSYFGFLILRSDEHWQDFLDSLSNDLHQEHSELPFSIMPDAM